MVVGKEGNTLFSDLLKTLYQSLSFIKGYLPSKVVYQADDLGSWPKTKFLVPRSLKKIPQSGKCPAPCVLCQSTSHLPRLQYICKALH